jgi:hypothetical protein
MPSPVDMPDDIRQDPATPGASTVWMTYAELAKSRGISVRSAQRLAQRHRWVRRPGNDGAARVAVPAGAEQPTERQQGDDIGGAGGVVAALRDARSGGQGWGDRRPSG